MKKASFIVPFLLYQPAMAIADDYPTLERVDHVLTCMKKHGGQTVDNLYSCSCEIDVIASKMVFDDFVEASTFEAYQGMPGDKGAIFRESRRGEEVVGKLQQAREDARKKCFIHGGKRETAGQ